jgi:hypothetical protein
VDAAVAGLITSAIFGVLPASIRTGRAEKRAGEVHSTGGTSTKAFLALSVGLAIGTAFVAASNSDEMTYVGYTSTGCNSEVNGEICFTGEYLGDSRFNLSITATYEQAGMMYGMTVKKLEWASVLNCAENTMAFTDVNAFDPDGNTLVLESSAVQELEGFIQTGKIVDED